MRDPIVKIAVADINPRDIRTHAMDKDDPEILQYFKKTAADLKAIAPKAKDFLYFTCIMMHAAEASLLDDAGNIKKSADGKEVKASWNKLSNGSWVWETNDSSILPYKNSNNDIFPEEELKKAYKKWVGKPLCLDHQSQSVDMIRGVIIDTVYDEKKKRVIALCALDKTNYPELAKKVASGVAASVSMGTAVGKAICTEKGCHRVARTESEFCEHMRAKSCYGEINVDLSPIELSIVVNGADPKAKIRRVIAAADKIAGYVDKQKLDEAGITLDEAKGLRYDLDRKIEELQAEAGDNLSLPSEGSEVEPPYGQGGRASKDMEHPTEDVAPRGNVPQAATTARYASEVAEVLEKLREKVGQLDNFINKMASVKEGSKQINEDTVMANKKEAYFLGGGGVNEPAPHQVKYPKEDSDSIRDNEDKQMNGQSPFPDTGPIDGMHPGYESFGESEAERKKRLQRMAAEQQQRQLRREAAMEKAKDLIKQRREAYFQGGGDVNEPTPHKPKYPKEDSDSIRDKEDKQMTGAPPFPGVGSIDGLYGDDEKVKKMHLRADVKLNASFVKAANPDGSDNLANSCWNIFAKDAAGNKRLVLSATVAELAGRDRVSTLYTGIATPEYGRKMIQTIREAGLEAAHGIFKSAAGNPFEDPTIQDMLGGGQYELHIKGPSDTDFRPMTDREKQFGKEKLEGLGYEFKTVKKAQLIGEPVDAEFGGMPTGKEVLYIKGPNDSDFRPMTDREKEFAQKHGKGKLEELGYQFKNVKAAQAAPPAPAAPGGQPGAAPDAAAPAPVPGGEMAAPGAEMNEDPEYAGETGSPVDKLEDNVRELGNLVAEMEKGLEGLKEEQGELGAEAPEVAGEAPVTTASMRVQLNKALIKGFKQAIAEAEDVKEELELVKHVVATGADRGNEGLVKELYADAQSDVKKAKANIKTMLQSFVSYASGNEIMEKVAGGMDQDATPITPPPGKAPEGKPIIGNPDASTQPVNPGDQKGKPMAADDYGMAGDDLYSLLSGDDSDLLMGDDEEEEKDSEEETEEHDSEGEEENEDEEDKDDLKFDKDSGSLEGSPDEMAKMMQSMSRAERDALRVKLAQKGLTFSDMLQKAHPQGGTTVDFDTKPQAKGDHVEDLKEAHEVHMDVATSAPRNVRMAAEKIQRLVTAGEIDPGKDFPALIAEGLDPQAVSYWKKMWGGTDPEAGQFVGDLVKDYQTKKAAEEKQGLQVKVARAYELAYAMAERGLISRDPRSLRQQVDRVMGYPDDAFNDFAKQIGKLPVKQASVSDVASVNGSYNEDRVVTATSAVLPPSRDEGNSLVDLFDQAFAGRKF